MWRNSLTLDFMQKKVLLRLIEPILCNENYTRFTRHTFIKHLIKTNSCFWNQFQNPGLPHSGTGDNPYLQGPCGRPGDVMSISFLCPTSPHFTLIWRGCHILVSRLSNHKVLFLLVYLIKIPSLTVGSLLIYFFWKPLLFFNILFIL